MGQGFRYNNQWMAMLTNNTFSPAFYLGDTLGSFNSWMRIITRLLAGLGLVWSPCPYFESYLTPNSPPLGKGEFAPSAKEG